QTFGRARTWLGVRHNDLTIDYNLDATPFRMNTPLVSVVVETITARFDTTTGSLADDLQRCLAGVDRQTYPRERIETIVVLDSGVSADALAEIRRRYPHVSLVFSAESNYFAAKNAGAAAAAGEIITLLDGDCEPSHDWLE